MFKRENNNIDQNKKNKKKRRNVRKLFYLFVFAIFFGVVVGVSKISHLNFHVFIH